MAITTDRFKGDVGQTWKRLADGWRQLMSRAADALTYFSPSRGDDDSVSGRWGLIAADVREDADHFLIEIEVPGLSKEDIDVDVEDRAVVVTGTKHYEKARRSGAMHITERAFGAFQRVIPLPAGVTAAGAEATYRRGVLRLTVPKASPSGTRRIPINRG